MSDTRPEGERFQERGETRVSLGGGRSIPEEYYDLWLNQALDDYTTAIIAVGRRCGTLPPPPTEETT